MPKLHTVVENLDEVPEGIREFYNEQKDKDDKVWFVLQLDSDVKTHPEVVALQRAHERQKEDNKKLKAQLTEIQAKVESVPEDFKPDEWERLREVEKRLNELKEKGIDPEKKEAHEAEIASFKKTHEQQVSRLHKQMEDGFKERDARITSLNGRIHNMVVRDGLVRLLAENGVKKEVLPFVQAKLERAVRVIEDDNGEPTMVFNTDLGEDVPATEYIPKWATSDEAKPFVEQASGGGAAGGNRKGGVTEANPYSKASWSMARQADLLKRDPARADRLAKAAGHKRAIGALQMDAQ